jgi:hypothetical protein
MEDLRTIATLSIRYSQEKINKERKVTFHFFLLYLTITKQSSSHIYYNNCYIPYVTMSSTVPMFCYFAVKKIGVGFCSLYFLSLFFDSGGETMD